MEQARRVDGGKRSAQVDADRCRLFDWQRATVADDGLERAAFDELRPDADLTAGDFRAVHGQHVGMAHAREQARFLNHSSGRLRLRRRRMQDLQRHLSLEPSIPRPIHTAEPAFADYVEERQVSPS